MYCCYIYCIIIKSGYLVGSILFYELRGTLLGGRLIMTELASSGATGGSGGGAAGGDGGSWTAATIRRHTSGQQRGPRWIEAQGHPGE